MYLNTAQLCYRQRLIKVLNILLLNSTRIANKNYLRRTKYNMQGGQPQSQMIKFAILVYFW